jgi:hypothetical protein
MATKKDLLEKLQAFLGERDLKIAFYKATNFLNQNNIDGKVTVEKEGLNWTAQVNCTWRREEMEHEPKK